MDLRVGDWLDAEDEIDGTGAAKTGSRLIPILCPSGIHGIDPMDETEI